MNFVRHFMKRLFYFLLLSFFIIIAGEIAIRFLVPAQPQTFLSDRTTAHPYIRTDWVPGFKRQYKLDGIGNQRGVMEFKINPYGFRSSSMQTSAKPPGTTRIFFLGESTTESIYIPEERTFPYLVEKSLSYHFPEKRFESINGAMSGNVAADTISHLIYKVMYYSPDIVVVMHAINDLRYGTVPSYDPIHRADYSRNFYFASFNETNEGGARFRSLLKQSRFLTAIKRRLLDRLSPSPIEKKYDAIREKRRQTPWIQMENSNSLDDFIKYMKEMIFIARGHGVRLILMTEPFIYQNPLPHEIDKKLWMGFIEKPRINLSNQFLLREMNRFNNAVRELSRQLNVELIDLEQEIPKNLTYFYDDVHLTPEGSKRAAEMISAYLIKDFRENAENFRNSNVR